MVAGCAGVEVWGCIVTISSQIALIANTVNTGLDRIRSCNGISFRAGMTVLLRGREKSLRGAVSVVKLASKWLELLYVSCGIEDTKQPGNTAIRDNGDTEKPLRCGVAGGRKALLEEEHLDPLQGWIYLGSLRAVRRQRCVHTGPYTILTDPGMERSESCRPSIYYTR